MTEEGATEVEARVLAEKSADPGVREEAKKPVASPEPEEPALIDPHAPPPPPPKPEEEPAPESEYVIKRRPMWPFVLVLVLIAGAVAGAIFYFQRKPEPLKVLVAIDYDGMPWEGSKASANFSDAISEQLKKVGFEPVKLGDPAVDAVLEKSKSPEEAARKLHAAFVITGTLTPKVIEEKLPAGASATSYFEARVDGDLEIRHIEDAAGKSEKGHVSNWSGATTKEQAVKTVGEGLADLVFDEVAPRMMEHPSIKELLSGSDVKAMAQIQAARKFVERRKHLLDEAKKNYEDLGKKHTSTPQPTRKISYHSSFDEHDLLAGVGPDGVLVQTANVSPLVSPDTADLSQIIRLETLEWRSPDGGDARVVWKGYHLYSYPSTAPGGSPVVFVEDLFGRAKTITVVDKGGESRRVRVDPSYRFEDPKIAPGGAAAAMIAKPCQGCPGGLLIVSLTDGKALHERSGDDRYGGWAWLDAKRLAYLVVPPGTTGRTAADLTGDPNATDPLDPPKPKYQLVTYDVTSNEVGEIGTGYDADYGFAFPTVSPDGKTMAVQHGTPDGRVIALIDTQSGALRDMGQTAGGENPAFSPDGSLVAFTVRGDVRLLHVKDGSVEELTQNPLKERYPLFSADGARVFFESLDDDPNFQRHSVTLIASVPVKP